MKPNLIEFESIVRVANISEILTAKPTIKQLKADYELWLEEFKNDPDEWENYPEARGEYFAIKNNIAFEDLAPVSNQITDIDRDWDAEKQEYTNYIVYILTKFQIWLPE